MGFINFLDNAHAALGKWTLKKFGVPAFTMNASGRLAAARKVLSGRGGIGSAVSAWTGLSKDSISNGLSGVTPQAQNNIKGAAINAVRNNPAVSALGKRAFDAMAAF